MRCPKCGKQLNIIHIRAGDYYGHSYTLAQVMGNKPMCDYNQVKSNIRGGIKGNDTINNASSL